MQTGYYGAGLAALAFAAQAVGQSFNIDCGGHLGIPPDSTYGAGSGQQGYWNPSGVDPVLRDLSGQPTSATIGGTAGSGFHDIPGAVGNDERFMETDFEMLASDRVVLASLVPGRYDLYAYSWGGQIFGPRDVGFSVWNGVDTSAGSLSFGTQWPGGQVEGETFARLSVEVLPEINALSLNIVGGGPKTFNVLAGIQLVLIPAPGSLAILAIAGLIASRRRPRCAA